MCFYKKLDDFIFLSDLKNRIKHFFVIISIRIYISRCFHSTSSTISFLDELIKSGETYWRSISEYAKNEKQKSPQFWLESDKFKYVSKYYNSSTPTLEAEVETKFDLHLKTMLLSNDIIASGNSKMINCRKRNKLTSPLWVVVPNAKLTGSTTNLTDTINQFRLCYNQKTFQTL